MKTFSILCAAALGSCLVWGKGLADTIPSPQPPVNILGCGGDYQSITDPNLIVGISFMNTSTIDATHVNFDILLLDSSAKTVESQKVSIDGHFAPNVLIQPRRSSIGDAMLTQPEYPNSPAWDVANHHGSDTAHLFCRVNSVTFADKTTWTRPQ
jgi:hypothetical protein